MSEPAPVLKRLAEVGRGASATVHRCVLEAPFGALPSATELALKVLHPELRGDPAARAAFEREARIGAAVDDPGLVRVHWAGTERELGLEPAPDVPTREPGKRSRATRRRTPDGPTCLVMTFVPGESLAEALIQRGPLAEPLLRSVGAQLAAGLAALHAAGFAHGDVKPENVRLDQAGRAVLIDLGFARATGPLETEGGRPTAVGERGARAGSLSHLAPERLRGGAPSTAADVFALGVVLYELATARHPFLPATSVAGLPATSPPGDRSTERLAALASARYVPPSRRAPWLSPLLDRLLREVLAREPEQRPAADELVRRLREQEASPWWRAQLELAGEDAFHGAGAYHLTPLVGRDGELALLRAAWQRTAEAGRARVAWLAGPAGSGKSRLVDEFADRARASSRPPIYLSGRCRTLVAQRPSGPVLELLQRWLGLPAGAAPGERERRLLQQSVPPSSARTLFQALDPEHGSETAGAVPAALCDWLLALGRRQPVLAFLDDLNFADEGTLLVVTLLVERQRDERLFLILGERDHEPPTRPRSQAALRERLAELGAPRIQLGPLDRRAVLELANRLFDHAVPRRRVAAELWNKSRGNPGLLVEILQGLIETGAAQGEPGHLRLAIDPDRIPLPRSLGTLINERFRRLSLRERGWLRRLSVVGGRLELDFLARAFPEASPAELNRLLQRFVTTGWLEPAGERFRFARPALRERVYRSASEQERLATHRAAAHALTPDTGDRIQLLPALQRAYHLHAAHEHEALLRVLPPLVQAMLLRGQPQRVVSLARWGLEALDALEAQGRLPAAEGRDRLRLTLLEAAADAADRLGRRGEQRAWLDQLSDADLSPDDHPAELARIYLLHGRYSAATGSYGLARGMFRNAVELARRAEVSDELESEALRRLAAVQAHVGELADARALASEALERAVHDAQRAVTWLQIGVIELLDDAFEEAFRGADRALALLREESDWRLPGIGAAAHMLRGRTYRVAGRPRRALGAMRHALRLARQAGERRLEAEVSARLGALYLDVDRVADAESRLREALVIARDVEDRRGEALAALWLGILLWEQDDPEALGRIERVVSQSRELGLGRVEAMALAIRARMHRAAGRLPQALADADRASELATVRGAELADRVVIVGTRVLVLEDVGRERDARELERVIRRTVRRVNQRIKNGVLRKRHADSSERLLAAVLDREGVIFPRLREG